MAFTDKSKGNIQNERKTYFKPEEILNAAKLKHAATEEYGCYCEESLTSDELPISVEKIIFRGDGYVDDNFIRVLKACSKLEFSNLKVVDFSGCVNLTDVGVNWLAEILHDSTSLYEISLDGCVNVTQHGISILGRLKTFPDISFCGANVSLIPTVLHRRLDTESSQFNGCPLLYSGSEDEKECLPSMAKVLIHHPPETKYSLASFIVDKEIKPAENLSYVSEWLHDGINFSISESVLINPKNDILQCFSGSHVLIPIDLDDSINKEVHHIVSVIHYNIRSEMTPSVMGSNLGKSIWPIRLMNSVWDDDTGRLYITNLTGQSLDTMKGRADDSDDEMDFSTSVAIFGWTATKTRPFLEFMVEECSSKRVPFMLSLMATSDALGAGPQGDAVELHISKGDVIRIGLKEPNKMPCACVIGEEGEEMTVTLNGERVDTLLGTGSGDALAIVTVLEEVTLRRLDHYSISGISEQKCGATACIFSMSPDGNPTYIYDEPSGIVKSGEKAILFMDGQPISQMNCEFEFEIRSEWSDGETPVFCGFLYDMDQTDLHEIEDVFRMLGFLFAPTLGQTSDGRPLSRMTEEDRCKPSDRIKLVVEGIEGLIMVMQKSYRISIYKNEKLVHQESHTVNVSIEDLDGKGAATFCIVIPQDSQIRLLNKGPSGSYIIRTSIASVLPSSCFLRPLEGGRQYQINDSQLSFPQGQNMFLGESTLTSVHHRFQLSIESSAEKDSKLCLGLSPYRTIRSGFAAEDFLIVHDPKKGDVYECAVDTSSINFDKQGVPVLDQDLKVAFKCNSEIVKELAYNYQGGGLHPTIIGSNLLVNMKNMNSSEAHGICSQSSTSRKQYIVVGMTEKKSKEDCQSTLDKVENILLGTLKKGLENVRNILDDVGSNVSKSFAGNEVQVLLEIHWRNLELLVNELSTAWNFLPINMVTTEGHRELCNTLHQNQLDFISSDYGPGLSQIIPKIFEKMHNGEDLPKLVSQETCREFLDVSEGVLAAAFNHLSKCGKVIFMEHINPWVAILDIPWFITKLKVLEIPPDTRAHLKTRGLMPDTPVWTDRELAMLYRENSMEQFELLLDVLMKNDLIIRLPGVRGDVEDVKSYFVSPANLRNPEVPLSHFYDPDKEEDNIMNLEVNFKFPWTLSTAAKGGVLCKCIQICKPIVVAPSYIVAQQGASQVVVLWRELKGSDDELIISVKTYMVKDANKDEVLMYTAWIAGLFEDVVGSTLLTASIPYMITKRPKIPAKFSLCAYHDWNGTELSGKISVCTLCGNCSQKGMSCEHNRILKSGYIFQCKCDPYIYCCQTCGICPKCATTLWDARSKLRPYLDMEKAMNSQRAFWGSMTYTEYPMSPYTVNEVSVVKVGRGESVKAINIGLLSKEGEQFIQLFPGRALVGYKVQGYHQKSREIITRSCIEENRDLNFNVGDNVSIHMEEAPTKSLDEDIIWKYRTMTVNSFYSTNCSISRISNTVANARGEIGMVMSQLANNRCYFDAEILSLPKGEVAGVGMTAEKEISQCIGHGTGHEATKDCEKWRKRTFAVGDIIGCGVDFRDDQRVYFTHNDELICEHTTGSENTPLCAAVLVQKGEMIRIMDNDIWKSQHDSKSEKSTRMPPNQELFEAGDGSISICPKETMLFDEPEDDERRVFSTVFVENHSEQYIIWKVKVNFIDRFTTDPIKGIIKPGDLVKYRAELKIPESTPPIEYKHIKDIKVQFIWAPLPKYHITHPDDIGSVEKADQLWRLHRKSLEEKQQVHGMLCQWRSNEGQFEQVIESNFAEEIWKTKYILMEPSYKVNVTKNGELIASYWVPKGEYRFAIETNTDQVNRKTVQEDIIVNMPRLPHLPTEKGNDKDALIAGSELPVFTVQAVRLYRSVLSSAPTLSRNVALLSYLPRDLCLKTLIYPSLSQLHDVTALNAYAVCYDHKDNEGRNVRIHFLDRPGTALVPPYFNEPPYGNSLIRYFYQKMAMSKVVMPLYTTMPQIEGTPTIEKRLQVENLMQSLLYMYAMTGYLHFNHSTTRGKIPNLDIDPADDEELPETCRYTDVDGILHDPYSEVGLIREQLVGVGAIEEVISKSPFLIELEVDVSDCGNKDRFDLKLPEIRKLVLRKKQPSGPQSEITVENCHNLHTLEIFEANVPHQLERCSNLEKLHIDGTLTCLPQEIGHLSRLTHLEVDGMLESLPSSFSLLKSLAHLSLRGYRMTRDKEEILERKFMKDGSSLHSKEAFDKMCLAAIPHGDGESEFSTDKEANTLTAASYYYTSRLGHDYSEGDIHGAFPRQILQLINLESLDLSYQAIRFIPRQISRLIHLRELKLRGCLELEYLPAALGSLPLVSLDLRFCVSLRTPSRDIVERGAEAVLAYLKQMERGKSRNWRTKLMLVGIGGAGKTTLLRALIEDSDIGVPTTVDDITLGIDIETWRAKSKENGKEVTFSVWDFAGQTVFYNTHQFFLSDRAVYILVWSGRQGYENSSLDFWLSSIQAHAPSTLIYVVATHADQLKTEIPEVQLKETYRQIVDFFLVGSTKGIGIPKLKASLIDKALGLDYVGQEVPRVFLDLEDKLISLRSRKSPYLNWETVTQLAKEVGIYEPKDVTQAVKFLHEVGTVQYFDYEILREYVVIDPQWIVNAMSSIVTFKNTAIKNGRLNHKELHKVWDSALYPKELHKWLLKLTEMFDLTFQVNDDDVSLVPCLLPHDKSKEVSWPPKQETGLVQQMIIYVFRYLPTGLFNRLQARLFEFSNSKSVWKNGSTLEKNGHYALIRQDRDSKLIVEVIGPCPEGILFLIHETLEELINGSYQGVTFEYLIPCPECVTDVGLGNSAMFEASLIREASKLAKPYIQCRKLFHTVPMTVCKALMPPDDNQELDLQLQRSVQALTQMKDSIKTDVFVLFCKDDVHDGKNEMTRPCPAQAIKYLEGRGFKCYYKADIKPSDTHTLMVAMQEAKTLLVFLSDALAEDRDCQVLLSSALDRFKKNLVLVNISKQRKWLQSPMGYNVGQEVYINMRKKEGDEYKQSLAKLEDDLNVRLGRKEKSPETDPACFISYAWSNSAEAYKNRNQDGITACDPRMMKREIEKAGIKCWLDIEQTGKRGLFEDITEGLRIVDVVVAFVSKQYSVSSNCMMEFRFATVNLSLPVIIVSVGTGSEWKQEEVGILAAKNNTPIVDMQNECTEEKKQEVINFVRSKLLTPKERKEKLGAMRKRNNKVSIEELINVSFREEYELAQRKIMRLVMKLASGGSSVKYPNLLTLDFVDEAERRDGNKQGELEKKPDASINNEMPDGGRDIEDPNRTKAEQRNANLDRDWCIKFLCEHDKGWHLTDKSIDLPGMTDSDKTNLLTLVAPYMARILPLLIPQTQGQKSLNCLRGDNSAFKEDVIRLAVDSVRDFATAYQDFQKFVLLHDHELSRGNLKRCLLPGGRIRWLCSEHSEPQRIIILPTDSSEGTSSQNIRKENEISKMIFESLQMFEHFRKVPKHKPPYAHGQDVYELINIQSENYKNESNEGLDKMKTGAKMTSIIEEGNESTTLLKEQPASPTRTSPKRTSSATKSPNVLLDIKPIPAPHTPSSRSIQLGDVESSRPTISGSDLPMPDPQHEEAIQTEIQGLRAQMRAEQQGQQLQMVSVCDDPKNTSRACSIS